MTTRADPRTPRARRLRHEATPQERKLWAALRPVEWPGGGHFRRQVPIGRYFADFAHHGLRLIVELDGGQHSSDDAVRRDGIRTAALEAGGYRVLRFWNAEIADNFEGVVETIYAAAIERAQAIGPRQPSPRGAAGRAESPSDLVRGRAGVGGATSSSASAGRGSEPADGPPTRLGLTAESALPTASGGRVGAALMTLALLLSVASPVLAQPTQQRQVGSWLLKWGAGRMGSYCTVETAQAGRTLGCQALKSGQGYFGIRNPAWAWTPRAAYDVRLSIVGGPEWSGKAVSALPDTLVLAVAPNSDPAPVAAMEAGRSATVAVEGGTIAFDLTDFPEAAKAQRDCLAQPG